jgi:hypothetical protein
MVGPKKIITILLLTDQNHALWRKRLSQIRYNVFADEQLVRDLHRQACAHAGRT